MAKAKAVEIPCQTCLTWSHIFQDKLHVEILFTCPGTSLKIFNTIQVSIFIFDNYTYK